MVNRAIDYGFHWVYNNKDNGEIENTNESNFFKQLRYFSEKNKYKKEYIKALYLHHLLDFFKETHVNISDIDLVFEKFLQNKVIIEISDSDGNQINFREELEEIFNLLKDNRKELYEDIK
ncbi:MAG: hypothetical protein JSV62_13615 [Promethearchaeota archaeon]|nr:MAG: hypothetical protein JSV62_13615 [Candidatus Lokiarchaeota archaeon]